MGSYSDALATILQQNSPAGTPLGFLDRLNSLYQKTLGKVPMDAGPTASTPVGGEINIQDAFDPHLPHTWKEFAMYTAPMLIGAGVSLKNPENIEKLRESVWKALQLRKGGIPEVLGRGGFQPDLTGLPTEQFTAARAYMEAKYPKLSSLATSIQESPPLAPTIARADTMGNYSPRTGVVNVVSNPMKYADTIMNKINVIGHELTHANQDRGTWKGKGLRGYNYADYNTPGTVTYNLEKQAQQGGMTASNTYAKFVDALHPPFNTNVPLKDHPEFIKEVALPWLDQEEDIINHFKPQIESLGSYADKSRLRKQMADLEAHHRINKALVEKAIQNVSDPQEDPVTISHIISRMYDNPTSGYGRRIEDEATHGKTSPSINWDLQNLLQKFLNNRGLNRIAHINTDNPSMTTPPGPHGYTPYQQLNKDLRRSTPLLDFLFGPK